jgi:arabinogalactan endo-1,4-beta-galactosidase
MDSMNSSQSSGVPLSIVSIGNEITESMLWALGEISVNGFYNLERLLHSASASIKYSTISPQLSIMSHLDSGWNYFREICVPFRFLSDSVHSTLFLTLSAIKDRSVIW